MEKEKLDWKSTIPTKIGLYICRIKSGGTQICFFDGLNWLDMWKNKFYGEVQDWVPISNTDEINFK